MASFFLSIVIGWEFIDAFRCTIPSFTHSWIKSTNINSLQSPKATALSASTHKRNNNLFCNNNTTHSLRNHLLTGKEMNKSTIWSLLSLHVIVFNLASLSFLCYERVFVFVLFFSPKPQKACLFASQCQNIWKRTWDAFLSLREVYQPVSFRKLQFVEGGKKENIFSWEEKSWQL